MSVNSWMSWEGGVDFIGDMSVAGGSPRNLIIHVARLVHTPLGSAPAGLISYTPDNGAPITGFLSTSRRVGEYFGPYIFKGTPFENAPVLPAQFDISYDEYEANARIDVLNSTFELRLSALGPLNEYIRPNNQPPFNFPFSQYVLEAAAGHIELSVDGERIEVTAANTGDPNFHGAVSSPTGIYFVK